MSGRCCYCRGTTAGTSKFHNLCEERFNCSGNPPSQYELQAYAVERGYHVPTWPKEGPPVQHQLTPEDVQEIGPIVGMNRLQSSPGRVYRTESGALVCALVCLLIRGEDGKRDLEHVQVIGVPLAFDAEVVCVTNEEALALVETFEAATTGQAMRSAGELAQEEAQHPRDFALEPVPAAVAEADPAAGIVVTEAAPRALPGMQEPAAVDVD